MENGVVISTPSRWEPIVDATIEDDRMEAVASSESTMLTAASPASQAAVLVAFGVVPFTLRQLSDGGLDFFLDFREI
jgi:hypothetical protein